MKNFICKRCNSTFNAKHHLISHLERKLVCQPIDNEHNFTIDALLKELIKVHNKIHVCDLCQKKFTTKSNLQRHKIQTCNTKYNINIADENSNNELKMTILECQKHIKQLEERLIMIENNKSDNNINNQNINGDNNVIHIQNNTFTIQLQNFGEESIQHLTNPFLDKCLETCNSGVTNLLREIHFNPMIPENHNIRSLSKKQNTLECYLNGAWHPCDKNNTLDKMIKNGYKILFRYFANNRLNTDSEEEQQKNKYINDYLTKLMRKEGNNYYELRRDLYMLILDGDFYIVGKYE